MKRPLFLFQQLCLRLVGFLVLVLFVVLVHLGGKAAVDLHALHVGVDELIEHAVGVAGIDEPRHGEADQDVVRAQRQQGQQRAGQHEDGNADVVSAETYLRYNATSNQDRFRYFKSSSYANQEAIQLFKKVSSTETLLGDVNDDKKVDVADVTALVNALKEGKEPTEGNIDGQNGVNAEDVRALVEMILSNSNQ